MKEYTAVRKLNITVDFRVIDANLSKNHLEYAICNYLNAGNINAVIGGAINSISVKVFDPDAKYILFATGVN